MLSYPARNYVKCCRGARWGGMRSIRECIEGSYVIIPRTQICKVLEGMQDGDVCLAFGSALRRGMLLYPAHKYVKCWRGCKMGRYA